MTTSKITRWTLLLASCATLFLASCKDNDDAYERPSISVTQLTKDSNGNTLIGKDESTATLHIRTNRSWTATTALDWLSISPESGDAGERDVTIKVLKNASGATRQGQFAFKAGNETLYYTITQAGDGSAVITPGKDQPTPNLPSTPRRRRRSTRRLHREVRQGSERHSRRRDDLQGRPPLRHHGGTI